jgi:CubicO group peptidase (beta-lactamase class C family)
VAERELRLTPRKPRGVEWDYSNFGFQVLSRALERAAGSPFGSLLEEHVFRPLGMTCARPGDGGSAVAGPPSWRGAS